MYLIINADDFGYTKGVNKGILQAMRDGVVTSTSLMVNQEGTCDALAMLRFGNISKVGVHLCLTAGAPLNPPELVPSLVNEQGRFKDYRALYRQVLPEGEVLRELQAQVGLVLSAGFKVTHLDTHHHIHTHPVILDALINIAKTYRLPVRSITGEMRFMLWQNGIPTPDHFCGDWFAGGVSVRAFKEYVTTALRAGVRVMELMTHPGIADDVLRQRSSYTSERERELAILCDPNLLRWLNDRNVRLSSYSVLHGIH
ncbi:MAG: carbohydrate deacetylase [Peptococcaceae bacterium]|nr:carbohydrate deacetylase [Peptococcaceae bacterium]